MAKAISDAAKAPDAAPAETEAEESAAVESNNEAVIAVATIGVVAVGALVFEAALLPGLALGVAASLAPKYLPRIGASLSPLFKSTVRSAYKVGQKAREVAAEAQEHMGDILAEVEAESGAKAKAVEAAAA